MPLLDQHDVMDEFVSQLAAARPVPLIGSAGRAVPLPTGSVGEVLAGRRSVRSFADRPIAATDLSELLGTALAAERDRWPVRPTDDLTVLVQAYRVRGLATGWYEAAADGSLTVVAGTPQLPDPAAHFDDAPAVLSFGGDLRTAVRHAGVAGYSDLLVRAAALAHNCWLPAIARGLGGCLRGRAQYVSTAAFVAGHPGHRHLLSLTLGHPGPEPARPRPESSADDRAAAR
ncbi:nitroreductase family protein [Streptomyces sp. NPDC004561]